MGRGQGSIRHRRDGAIMVESGVEWGMSRRRRRGSGGGGAESDGDGDGDVLSWFARHGSACSFDYSPPALNAGFGMGTHACCSSFLPGGGEQFMAVCCFLRAGFGVRRF
ncbi:hypothetical protein M758_1G291100 [Ceratodon purpureus]|nr:hypothetical protein M758_1G291100 [Ceratodon purpureus]